MRTNIPFTLLLATIFCLVLSCCGLQSQDEKFINDQAQLLSPEETRHLIEFHNALLRDFDVHFKLITLASSSRDINEQAVSLFADLGSETQGKKGLLFLVDPGGKQIRIEVGYDLESYFPDIFIHYLETRQMVPFFAAGRVGSGIEATSELLIGRLQQAINGKEYDPGVELPNLSRFSGGAGAKTAVNIGHSLPDKPKSGNAPIYRPQETPEKSLEVYKLVLAAKVKDPDLAVYSPETRDFFRNWVVTDAQQENELRSLNRNISHEVRIQENRAVIRFPASERTLPPYLLIKGSVGWMLDFHSMSKILQMNQRNMWHFRTLDHAYIFAFNDWKFDQNGFPMIETGK